MAIVQEPQVVLCRVGECEDEAQRLGYCWRHYRKQQRHGDPLGGFVPVTDPMVCRGCEVDRPLADFPLVSNGKGRKTQLRTCRRCLAVMVYGLTAADYDRMLAAQGNACAICASSTPGGRWGVFVVDHDAETGRVRGLLCNGCNAAIGGLRHDPALLQRAIEYLDEHRA